MYTVAKGPTALLQKSRRGMKSVDGLDSDRQKGSLPTPSPPATPPDYLPPEQIQLVFHPVKHSRGHSHRRRHGSETTEPEEEISEEHRRIVNFLCDEWSRVQQEINSECKAVKYHSEPVNPDLSEFQPFDLEAWMGQRLYQTLLADI